MQSQTFHLKKNQFFHNRGWIATNFKVKTSLTSKNKLKKILPQKQQSTYQHSTYPIHCRYFDNNKLSKPTSYLSQQKTQNINPDDYNTLFSQYQSKNHNFKTTISNKKSILFMKPYASKNRSITMSINDKKSQVYQQINNPDVLLLSDYFNKTGVIQYLTQYKQPFETKKEREKIRPKSCSKGCINVLKQKLKKKCGLSNYQSKIRGLKYQ